MAYTNEVKWLHCALIGRSNGGEVRKQAHPVGWSHSRATGDAGPRGKFTGLRLTFPVSFGKERASG